jgi:hypothetical protein
MADARTDERVARQRAFFSREVSPDCLVFIGEDPPRQGQPSPTGIMARVNEFAGAHDGRLPDDGQTDGIVGEVVAQFRTHWQWRLRHVADDAIPIVPVHFDIGIQTAVMTGLEPQFLTESWWLEPNLGWDAIDALAFDPDNRWFRMFLAVNRSLWKHWEEDYFFLPFWHRSPLDAANGIRGTALFEEMYTEPDRVKRLVDWCVDCELEIERRLYEDADGPEAWGIGHMGMCMPKGAVWVNGDPVTMISREMMREFEQPFTGRLFTSTGGGFFHNHTKGLFQVDQVARTPGIVVQHFNRDPNCPCVADVLSGEAPERERLLDASRRTPIYVDQVKRAEVGTFLPHLASGRFLLQVLCSPDETETVLKELRNR